MGEIDTHNPKAPEPHSVADLIRACFDTDLSALRVVNVTGVGFTTTSTTTSTTTTTSVT